LGIAGFGFFKEADGGRQGALYFRVPDVVVPAEISCAFWLRTALGAVEVFLSGEATGSHEENAAK